MAETGHLETLIMQLKESLGREIGTMRSEILARFDAQAGRLDRLGADNRAGQRLLLQRGEWSDSVDQQIEAILKRLGNLENKEKTQPPPA